MFKNKQFTFAYNLKFLLLKNVSLLFSAKNSYLIGEILQFEVVPVVNSVGI